MVCPIFTISHCYYCCRSTIGWPQALVLHLILMNLEMLRVIDGHGSLYIIAVLNIGCMMATCERDLRVHIALFDVKSMCNSPRAFQVEIFIWLCAYQSPKSNKYFSTCFKSLQSLHVTP